MTQAPPRRAQDAAHQPGRQHRSRPARGLAGRAPARGRRAPGHAAQRHRRQRHVLGDPGPRRDLDRGRRARDGQVRRAGGAVRRRRPGLPELRPAGPVRRHADRRRAHRRAGAGRRASWSRPARCSARRSSSWTASRASCRRTSCPTTSATTGSSTRRAEDQRRLQDSIGRRARRAARDPGRHRRRSPSSTPAATSPVPRQGTPMARNLAARERGTSSPSPTSAGRRWSRRSSTGWRPTSPPTPATPC